MSSWVVEAMGLRRVCCSHRPSAERSAGPGGEGECHDKAMNISMVISIVLSCTIYGYMVLFRISIFMINVGK